ncbi:MAG: PilZ domain-containing protein [Methylococcaceae bacterium]|nr:PilZ domain-containing protein [Methylococcaceae bacterium]
MSENDFPAEIFDELDRDIPLDSLWSNKRVAVRYRRKDIKAVVKVHSLLYPRLLPVALRDISSRGAAVMSPKKISRKSRVCLYLLFDDGKRFEIEAIVVHASNAQVYGLKFNSFHEALADHLLHSQTDLTFS